VTSNPGAWRNAIDEIADRTVVEHPTEDWAYDLFNSAARKINAAFDEVEKGLKEHGH
jgi:hypothetical protein